MTRRRTRALAAAALAAALAPAAAGPGSARGGSAENGSGGSAAAASAAPRIEQLVVFRSGRARFARVGSGAVTVRVGRRRCAVPARTPLAALVRSRPSRIRLRDFGRCSRRPADAAGLFVSAIGADRNRGQDGWVYKVGRVSATAGAADPSGPFGRGRLRRGQRVTWFYCHMRGTSCQRTLALRVLVEPGRVVAVTVVGYDDGGHGVRVGGAAVRGLGTQRTAADGTVRVAVAPGTYRVRASRAGLVRSFTERVVVR